MLVLLPSLAVSRIFSAVRLLFPNNIPPSSFLPDSPVLGSQKMVEINVLSGKGLVVHQKKLDVLDVADEEGLVAGGHHVLGLLVGAIADLLSRGKKGFVLATVKPENGCFLLFLLFHATPELFDRKNHGKVVLLVSQLPNHPLDPQFQAWVTSNHRQDKMLGETYRGHGKIALEPSADAVVDTLRFAPCWVHAHKPVTLVTGERLRAYTRETIVSTTFCPRRMIKCGRLWVEVSSINRPRGVVSCRIAFLGAWKFSPRNPSSLRKGLPVSGTGFRNPVDD